MQRALSPSGPLMRYVEHDQGVVTQRVHDRVEGVSAEIVDLVQRRRRSQQAEMIGAFRQQAIGERRCRRAGREHGLSDALRRILTCESRRRGAEGEIEVGDHQSSCRSRAIDQRRYCGRGWRRRRRPWFSGHMATMRPTGLASGRREQAADRAPDGAMVWTGADHVVGNAAADQFAIEHDVVEAADHDDARAGVAELR